MGCEGSGGLSVTCLSAVGTSTLLLVQGLPPVKTFLSNEFQIFSVSVKDFYNFFLLSNVDFKNYVFLFKPQQFSLKVTFPSLFSNPRNVIFMTKA